MKKLMEMVENAKYSTREYVFVGLILFLSGLILGVIMSPKGVRTIGSNNGSNNQGFISDGSKEDGSEE